MKLTAINRYVPKVTGNPLKLSWRLLTEENPAARSALMMAIAGAVLSPIDSILSRREKRLCEMASDAALPTILVCGPPRSGTTLVAQYLINEFDVAYINNLTSLFPRSPITANRLFGRFIGTRQSGYEAFYGRTRGLSGVNDGLYIWDRWLGSDRQATPERLTDGSEKDLPQFFGAFQKHYGLPVVNKANRLVTCADLVSPLLKNSFILCLKRDPVLLAQSLLIARREISGNEKNPYGARHDGAQAADAVEDVCLQVEFYERHINRLQRALGPEKFAIVQYEEFCSDTARLKDLIHRKFGNTITPARQSSQSPANFKISNAIRLPDEEYRRLINRFNDRSAVNAF